MPSFCEEASFIPPCVSSESVSEASPDSLDWESSGLEGLGSVHPFKKKRTRLKPSKDNGIAKETRVFMGETIPYFDFPFHGFNLTHGGFG